MEAMKDIVYLHKGDSIELVAPSFGCVTEPYKTRLEVAIHNLKKEGFKIIEGPNIHLAKDKIRSNSPKECAREFNEAYLHSPAKAIISVGGGEIMDEILPYVNFKAIKKAPFKFFMGFSDNTNLSLTLTTMADTPTVYGPCAPSFAFKPFEYSTKDSLELLLGKKKRFEGYPLWERYPSPDNSDPLAPSLFNEPKTLRLSPKGPIQMEGRLIGGCLDCIVNLCGTRFDHVREFLETYKNDGFIWFLEACDLSPVSIERALFQLREAGYFKYCKGFIFGRPLCYRQRVFGINHINAYKRSLGELHLPMIMDADLGHYNPSMPIICGAKATVTADLDNSFVIEY